MLSSAEISPISTFSELPIRTEAEADCGMEIPLIILRTRTAIRDSFSRTAIMNTMPVQAKVHTTLVQTVPSSRLMVYTSMTILISMKQPLSMKVLLSISQPSSHGLRKEETSLPR